MQYIATCKEATGGGGGDISSVFAHSAIDCSRDNYCHALTFALGVKALNISKAVYDYFPDLKNQFQLKQGAESFDSTHPKPWSHYSKSKITQNR